MTSFDLLERPWLPVRDRVGAVCHVGLREALREAHALRELADPAPLCLAAEMRLLVALVHRVVGGPTDDESWQRIWSEGRFDPAAVDAYFSRWGERFDLFHPERPFYQQRVIARGAKAQDVAALTFERPSTRNKAFLFDHTTALELAPGDAARHLLAQQAFALGGLLSPWPDDPGSGPGNLDAPLARVAHAFLRGRDLFETLALNLVRLDPENVADLPSWERTEVQVRSRRVPRGPLDLLTWQSRAIELVPDDGRAGMVTHAAVLGAEGFSAEADLSEQGEPFVAFFTRRAPKPGERIHVPLRFSPGRVAWRDYTALASTESGPRGVRRPMTVSALARRRDVGYGPEHAVYDIDVIGLAADKAKVELWRHERFQLPAPLVLSEEACARVAQAMDVAEAAAKALADPDIWKNLVRSAGGPPDRRDVTRTRTAALHEDLYWAALEPAFHRFIGSFSAGADGDTGTWNAAVRTAAQRTFDNAMTRFEVQPGYLLGVARAERAFLRALRQVFEVRA